MILSPVAASVQHPQHELVSLPRAERRRDLEGERQVAAFVLTDARPIDPRRLDVEAFAKEGGQLDGDWPLPSLERLADAAHPDARPVESDLARWHAAGGRVNLALIWLHAVYAMIGWLQVTGAGIGVATIRLLRLPGLVPATIGTLLMFAIGINPQFVFNIFNATVVQIARLLA